MIKNEWGIKRPDVSELPFDPDVLGSIICFSLSYDPTESGGSGFLVDDTGTVITACHVLKDRVEEWGRIESVPIALSGQPVIRGLSLIEADPEKDFAILQSKELSGAPYLPIGKKRKLDEGSSFWVLGFPDSFTDFPFRRTLAASKGKFLGEVVRSQPSIQQLSCAIWSGFSGGPVVDEDGLVRGIAIAGNISRTSDDIPYILDIAYILPLSEIAYP